MKSLSKKFFGSRFQVFAGFSIVLWFSAQFNSDKLSSWKGGGNTNQVWVASLFYIFIKHTYLLVFPISVSFKTIRSMQLNGGAADHLNTAFLILWSKGPYTAVHLQ